MLPVRDVTCAICKRKWRCLLYLPSVCCPKEREVGLVVKVKHTLGEDVIGMVFYGYDAPVIETNLAGTIDLGKVSSGYAVLTFRAANKRKRKGFDLFELLHNYLVHILLVQGCVRIKG